MKPVLKANRTLANEVPAPGADPTLLEWLWPLPRWYNGFSPEERVRGWQAVWWLVDQGQLAPPHACSVTGLKTGERPDPELANLLNAGRTTGPDADPVVVVYHSENYYDPFAVKPIAREAHRLLHRRFFDPGPWCALVEHCSRTGEEWFGKLDLVPIDLAEALSAQKANSVKPIDILMTRIAKR